MDKLIKRVDELEIKNRTLEFEITKLKEAIVLIDAKINKKPFSYFDVDSTDSSDSSDNDFFYLDNINGI
jgi:hypothetical protein